MALYLHVANVGAAVNAAILLILSALVFWRVRYVYPTRTPVLRGVTISLGAIWAVCVLLMILALPAVRPMLVVVSLFFPAYYLVLSAALHLRVMRGAAAR